MLITDTLDVGIGLALVYLLVSLIMTSLSEAIEAFLKKRAVDLERAIAELLQGDEDALKALYEHPLISALYAGAYEQRVQRPAGTAPADDAKPMRAARRRLGRNLPSYIPRNLFSAVLTELHENNQVNDRIRRAIDTLSRATGFDPAATSKGIENWYDDAMDRAAGWYKRRTQARLLWMGLFVAVLANVNSVTIANYLAYAPQARKAVVQIATDASARTPGWLAQDRAAASTGTAGDATAGNALTAPANSRGPAPAAVPGAGPPTPDPVAYYHDYQDQLEKIGLPIGWSEASRKQTLAGFEQASGAGRLLAAFLLAAGYLTTALAIMLGAPFWFDLLGRLIVVRSTVKPDEKSPDESSKDARADATAPATPAPGSGAVAAGSPALGGEDSGGPGGGEQLVYG